MVERSLVHERQWLSPKEFVESLAIAQALPGPNVMNMAVMVGDRYSGLKGSLAAVAGMITIPMLIVLTLTSVGPLWRSMRRRRASRSPERCATTSSSSDRGSERASVRWAEDGAMVRARSIGLGRITEVIAAHAWRIAAPAREAAAIP